MTETFEDYVDFGTALDSLKEGNKIRRSIWDEGAYIELIDPKEQTTITTVPAIYIYTWDGTIMPWFAPPSDILAEDWFII